MLKELKLKSYHELCEYEAQILLRKDFFTFEDALKACHHIFSEDFNQIFYDEKREFVLSYQLDNGDLLELDADEIQKIFVANVEYDIEVYEQYLKEKLSREIREITNCERYISAKQMEQIQELKYAYVENCGASASGKGILYSVRLMDEDGEDIGKEVVELVVINAE